MKQVRSTTVVQDMHAALNFAHDSGAKSCVLNDENELIKIYIMLQNILKLTPKKDQCDKEYEVLSHQASPSFKLWEQSIKAQGLEFNPIEPDKNSFTAHTSRFATFEQDLENEFTLGYIGVLNDKLEMIERRIIAGDLQHLRQQELKQLN